MFDRCRNAWVIEAVSVAMTAGIFVIDLLTPLGYTVWLLYLLPMGLAVWTRWVGWPFVLAGLISVLIGLGFDFSPPGVSSDFALLNRLIGVALFWTIAISFGVRNNINLKQPRFGLSGQTIANLSSACLVLALIGSITYRITIETRESERLIAHTYEVLAELSLALSSLKDAETGQQGFLLTGQDRYLEPYNRAVTEIGRHHERLKRLTQNNHLQQGRLLAVEAKIEEKLAELGDTIIVRRDQGPEAARRFVETDRGKDIMGAIHRLVGEMEGTERVLLAQRIQKAAILFKAQLLILLLGGGALAGLTAITILLLRREQIGQRKHAAAISQALATLDATTDGIFVFDPRTLRFTYLNEGAVKQMGYSQEELLRMTPLDIKPEFDEPRFRAMIAPLVSGAQPTHRFTTVHRRKDGVDVPVEINLQCIGAGSELARMIAIVRDITKHKQAEKELRHRSELLKAANRELEAFSYSVSHDLRAPLRHIDGFSRALLNECASQMPERGRDYLMRIRSSCERMESLIGGLLMLSRSDKSRLQRRAVDVSALVTRCADEIRKTWFDRQMALLVAPGMNAHGDPALLEIVFLNLLDNAWKYTSLRERAVIEVGVERHNGEWAYFVRDNGVGFDGALAKKLFRPFQRLHAAGKFPGLGIGLASVQRVVHRHGGRIWVDSSIGQGTTVYFTLGAHDRKNEREVVMDGRADRRG